VALKTQKINGVGTRMHRGGKMKVVGNVPVKAPGVVSVIDCVGKSRAFFSGGKAGAGRCGGSGGGHS